MKKFLLINSIIALLFVSAITALPTEIDLPNETWNGGIWQRFHPDKDMKTRLIERFGGKTTEQTVKELYVPAQPIPLKPAYRKVVASIKVVGGLLRFETTGQDNCKTHGTEYCKMLFNEQDKQKCNRNTLTRCALLQPYYD